MQTPSTIIAFYIKNSALSKLLKTYPFLSVSIENGTVATGGINDAWSIESIVRHPNNFSSVTQWLLYLLSNHIHIFDINSKSNINAIIAEIKNNDAQIQAAQEEYEYIAFTVDMEDQSWIYHFECFEDGKYSSYGAHCDSEGVDEDTVLNMLLHSDWEQADELLREGASNYPLEANGTPYPWSQEGTAINIPIQDPPAQGMRYIRSSEADFIPLKMELDYYEDGKASYIEIDVTDINDQVHSLRISPMNRYNAGGGEADIYIKPADMLAAQDIPSLIDELFDSISLSDSGTYIEGVLWTISGLSEELDALSSAKKKKAKALVDYVASVQKDMETFKESLLACGESLSNVKCIKIRKGYQDWGVYTSAVAYFDKVLQGYAQKVKQALASEKQTCIGQMLSYIKNEIPCPVIEQSFGRMRPVGDVQQIEFEGNTFVLTGLSGSDLTMVKSIIEQSGGVVNENFVKKAKYLIFTPSDSVTSKYSKARVAGTPCISTGQFFEMVNVKRTAQDFGRFRFEHRLTSAPLVYACDAPENIDAFIDELTAPSAPASSLAVEELTIHSGTKKVEERFIFHTPLAK